MMRYITSLLMAILGFAILTHAAPAVGTFETSNNTIVGTNATYNVVDIVWNVTINNTATPYNVSATGTVQDALTKMAMFDPVSAAAINASVLSNTTSAALDQSVGPNEDYVATTRFCNNMPGGLASSLRIKQGIQYLGTVSGTPTEGPGPGNCGRVSCSYGGAIYWCNDNLDTKILSSYLNIADGAQLVVDYCENTYVGGVNGQQFYEDGWNVIVRYENC